MTMGLASIRRVTMRRPAAWAILAGVSGLLGGCSTQTIIYKDVPEYQLREGIVQPRVELPDGTIIIHRPRKLGPAVAGGGPAETNPDGTPRFRALQPEQVISFTLRCITDETYELLWEEALAKHTKDEYEAAGMDFDDFAEFMRRNRDDLFAMLNRMVISMGSTEVIVEQGPLGGIRCRFHPYYGRAFKFDTVDMVYEGYGLKLLMIRPRIAE
ncbi:MAG: hypothetical protein HRU76_12660 [Phycisphaeraceae bacterium]|nr:hypothetical protein [Phycisphaerales bacterium]QOJ18387.1 MAG: hypothetical protein HRU76_12660 [Phycisphaeraceae bacterium]